MKHTTILILLFMSKLSLSYELVRLSNSQREILNQNFNRETAQILERLGSGDIVGNGGGLIEQNFMSAYYNIQLAIQNCLNTFECGVDDQEKSILKEINTLYIQKVDQTRPVIFVNESIAEDFFKSKEDQTTRIAKTGFTKDSQVFINLEMAESIKTDISTMISILIHELGHQTGIANHSILDQVGAKVRNQWNSNSKVLSFEMENETLDVHLFSTEVNYISSKLTYTYKEEVQSLNNDIFEQLNCGTDEIVYGFNLSNGHWRRPIETDRTIKIGIDYWIDIYCENLFGDIRTVKKDLDLTFKIRKFFRQRTKLSSVKVKIK